MYSFSRKIGLVFVKIYPRSSPRFWVTLLSQLTNQSLLDANESSILIGVWVDRKIAIYVERPDFMEQIVAFEQEFVLRDQFSKLCGTQKSFIQPTVLWNFYNKS